MYQLPKLNIPKQKTETIAEFKGLNERAAIADNELADCYNISLENSPALSVRDGYEEAVFEYNPISLQARILVRKNLMVTDYTENGLHKVYFYYYANSQIYYHPIYVQEEEDDFTLLGVELFNNDPVILFVMGAVNEQKVLIRRYSNFEPEYEMGIEGEEYDITSLFAPEPCNFQPLIDGFGGFLSFGSRMIIAEGALLHISYFNALDKWTVYNEDGTENDKCAKTIEVLDDGNYTGCVNYRDYPIFFKENSMYILYGEYTSAFDLGRIDAIGCTGGESIAICNGALYFLSKLGVMEYTGGTPKLISRDIKLNPRGYYPPYACADNRFYYISDYVYDTYTKTWSKVKLPVTNGAVRPVCCYSRGGRDQIYIQTDDSTYIEVINAPADWSFATKHFHEYQAGKKIISRLVVGFENVSLSELKIEVSLDKGEFKAVYTWDGSTDFVKEVPVILPPCDYFQLRVSGTGKVYVHYIKRIYRVLGR